MVALGLTSRKQMLENTEGAIKNLRNWQHRTHYTKIIKTKTQHNMCRTSFDANKHKQEMPPLLLQSGGKDESNIVFMRKSSRTLPNGTKNVKVFILQYERIYWKKTNASYLTCKGRCTIFTPDTHKLSHISLHRCVLGIIIDLSYE